jgi:hypothetical protein
MLQGLCEYNESFRSITYLKTELKIFQGTADKSLARPARKQATATKI